MRTLKPVGVTGSFNEMMPPDRGWYLALIMRMDHSLVLWTERILESWSRPWGFCGGSVERIHLPTQNARVQSLVREDPLEEEVATHFSILAWEIPWTEEPVGVQSIGLQRVRHD